MPIYSLCDKKTGKSKEVFMHISEFNSYTERDEDGKKIYTGDEFSEAEGEIFFAMASFTTKLNAPPPKATRKFGDKIRTPNFGKNRWV